AAGLLAETDLDLLAEVRAFDPAFFAVVFLAPAVRDFALLDFAADLFAGRAFFAAAFLLGAALPLPFSNVERRRSKLSKRCSTPPALLLFPAFTMILPFFIGNINHYI